MVGIDRFVQAGMLAGVVLLAGCAPRELTPNTSPHATIQEGTDLTHLPGLHNVHVFGDGVVSGSMPHGEAGLDSLRKLGIKTILSVDGARPDVEGAEARGMRYAHVPIEYSGMTQEEQDGIAAAIWELPRPIYVHCHHGKHRGPAAAAYGLVATGEIDSAQGHHLLEVAGTSDAYTGLWHCVDTAQAFSSARWMEVPESIPSVAEVTGMVASMADIDRRWDNLKLLDKNEWQTPADHPDIVGAAEAGMLADRFRTIIEDPQVVDGPDELRKWMEDAATLAVALEDAIVADNDAHASELMVKLGASCKTCHGSYRNNTNW